jgi:hypothetical protein
MFIETLPKPTVWLVTFWDYVQKANVPTLVGNLAIVLLLVAIIWSGIKIATMGTGTQDYMGFFLRVLVAGYLVLSAAPLSQLTRDAWTDAVNWGYATFAAPAVTRAQDEMKNLGTTAGYVAGAAIATAGIVSGVGAIAGTGSLITGAGAAVGSVARASTVVAQATNWIVWMAIPIVLVYYVIILGTGFSILIGSIILPLAGALMMFPSTLGADWMGKWIKATVAAIFSAAFVPLVFATALEVGFVGPAKQYNASLEKNAKEWSAANQSYNWGDVTKVGENLGKAFNQLTAQFGVALNYIGSFITSIFMLIIGVVAGVMVINTLSGQISSFVGGSLTAGGSGAIAGAGIALARGVGAVSGKLGSMKAEAKSDFKMKQRDATADAKSEANYQRSRQDSASDSLNAQKQQSSTASYNQDQARQESARNSLNDQRQRETSAAYNQDQARQESARNSLNDQRQRETSAAYNRDQANQERAGKGNDGQYREGRPASQQTVNVEAKRID